MTKISVELTMDDVYQAMREMPQLDYVAASFVALHRKGVKFSPNFVPELRHLQGEWTAYRDHITKSIHFTQKLKESD